MNGTVLMPTTAQRFALIYVLLMLPTYVLPYMGSNSLTMILLGVGILPFLFHAGAMAGLVYIAKERGAVTGKPFLLYFPILAIVFDFVPVLSAIPFVPTAMHVAALVLGLQETRSQPSA